MKLIAKVDLPNGTKAGERLDIPDYQAQLLLGMGVVERDEPDDADAVPPAPVSRRATYRRRDLTAEERGGES